LTLLALQIGFLPYHSEVTTFAHQTALGLDALALLWFWPRLAAGMTKGTWRWWLPFGAGRPAACRGWCRTGSVGVLGLAVLFGWRVAVLPGERLEDDGRLSNKLHRNLDLHEKLLVANDPDLETLAKLQESDLKPNDRHALLIKIKGLDLQGRDLRFADLSQTKLWRADLRQATLQRVNLSDAQMQEIKGNGVWLQDAKLKRAQMQGADLRGAEMQSAVLVGVRMQGADFSGAEMRGVVLVGARMQGAVLSGAGMQGADLRGAEMQGADFTGAAIGSASFISSNFALNTFRNLGTTPFNKQDFEFWRANIRPLLNSQEWANEWTGWLKSRIGKPIEFPEEGVSGPCLADAPRSADFQRCQAPNPAYFEALAHYLGDLACGTTEKLEGQEFIAKGIARQRVVLSGEWGTEGAAAQRKLAQRLLRDDCAGKAGLDENLRAELRKLPEAPEPKPPATTANSKAPASRSTRLSGTGRNDEKH
jgi:uncharacterized protein YjbI with pentapeptide repeats